MNKPTEQWLRAEFLTTNPELDSNLLPQLGALGVEIQDSETYMEDGSIPPVPDGKSRLIAFFNATPPSDETPESLRDKISQATSLPVDDISVINYDDTSWQTAWQAYFKPIRLSPRSIVGPPWEEFAPPTQDLDGNPIDDGVKIVINPGLAFGTGSHETTQLAATMLDNLIAEHEESGAPYGSMLDVGCGSGILSILAYLLGIPNVRGIDIDEDAIESANKTLQTYDLTEILLTTLPLAKITQSFPIVVANILGSILLENLESLARVTDPGGDIILSGVLEKDAQSFIEQVIDAGFTLVTHNVRDEWAAFHFTRNMPKNAAKPD